MLHAILNAISAAIWFRRTRHEPQDHYRRGSAGATASAPAAEDLGRDGPVDLHDTIRYIAMRFGPETARRIIKATAIAAGFDLAKIEIDKRQMPATGPDVTGG